MNMKVMVRILMLTILYKKSIEYLRECRSDLPLLTCCLFKREKKKDKGQSLIFIDIGLIIRLSSRQPLVKRSHPTFVDRQPPLAMCIDVFNDIQACLSAELDRAIAS